MAMKAGHHEKKALSSLFVVGGCGSLTKFNVGCEAASQKISTAAHLTKQKEISTKVSKG